MSIDSFKDMRPVFLPEVFFHGSLRGWAVLESPIGGLLRRSVIDAVGTWDAGSQTISFTETYRFDDGRTDTLNWKIRKLAPGRYAGEETNLNGEAEGEQAGCAFHWRYSRNTPQSGGASTLLNFNDWFYAIDDQTCIVRGSAGRAGIPFLTAHVTYRRASATEPAGP